MKILAIFLILTFIAIISCTDDLDFKPVSYDTICTDKEEEDMENFSGKELAIMLGDQADVTVGMMEEFKDEYAQNLQNIHEFKTLLKSLKGKEWLRAFDWYEDDILPKEKEIGSQMPSSYLEKIQNNSDVILPKLHKAMKMIYGSVKEMQAHGFDTYHNDTLQNMKKYIDSTVDAAKIVLCTFTMYMEVNDIEMLLDLSQSDIPKITEDNNGLLYRDTLNFLEYLSQVFRYIAQNTTEDPDDDADDEKS